MYPFNLIINGLMCMCNPHPAPLPSNKARQRQLGRSWSARTPDGWQLQLQLSCLGVTTLLGLGRGPTLAEQQEAEQADGEHLHGHAGHGTAAGHISIAVTVVTAGV